MNTVTVALLLLANGVVAMHRPTFSPFEQDASAGILDFGEGIRTVQINIGPNIDPLMPPDHDQSVAVLAVEANAHLSNRMASHPRLFVMYCAISEFAGVQMFNVYNNLGLSSSLAKTTEAAIAHTNERVTRLPVPVLPLWVIIDAIPAHIEIDYLKTDLQGFDAAALHSGLRKIRRVKRIMCECYSDGYTGYEGVKNNCERDIAPMLKRVGFNLDRITNGYKGERDAHFTRID